MINARTIIDTFTEASTFARDLVYQLRLIHRTFGIVWLASATTQVINNAATKISIFNAEEGDGVTVSHANDKLTILHSGRYRFDAHLSIAAQAGSGNVTLQIWRNGSAIAPAASKVWIGNGEFGDLGAFTIGDVDKDDEIELYALGGGGLTFDVAAASLAAKRVA